LVQVWRLIDSDLVNGPTSQAIDEAILRARVEEMVPNTLHLFRRKSPTVSIGSFQKVEDVVDLEYCRQQGIEIVRRISGGGAICTDSNCLEYSVVVNLQYEGIPIDTVGSFKAICAGIIKALGRLGIDATYKPINDVLVGGRKISGSAQRRRGHILLQHGTLLVDADFERMGKALKAGDEGEAKLTEKLTTIRREAKRFFTMREIKEALKAGFEESLSMKLLDDRLSPWEEGKIKELARKYKSRSWIFTARQPGQRR